MDYIKLQMAILKMWSKSNNNADKQFRVARDTENNRMLIAPNGTCMFVVPIKEYLLNLPEFSSTPAFAPILNIAKKEGVKVRGTGLTSGRGKDAYMQLDAGTFKVWVSQQKLKLFGNPGFLTLVAYGELQPVFVYDVDWKILLGVIAPARIKI